MSAAMESQVFQDAAEANLKQVMPSTPLGSSQILAAAAQVQAILSLAAAVRAVAEVLRENR